jgi:hypothetical protein
VRKSPAALRFVGALVLSGTALHIAWLTAPPSGGFAALPMALLVTLILVAFVVGSGRAVTSAKGGR